MKKPIYKSSASVKGRYKIEVLNPDGSIAQSRDWRPNLLLDRGLNRLAVKSFAELFTCAAKGTGTTATKEDGGGSYSLVGTSVTRVSGRAFTADDVGRLIRSDDGVECIVINFVDADNVDVRAVGTDILGTFTTEDITVYHTELTALEAEDSRTDTYSAVAGENNTTDGTGVNKHKRTLKRTFIFDPEPEQLETIAETYTWSGTVVTQDTGTRDFTADDAGKYIKFSPTDFAVIVSMNDATPGATKVNVDRSGAATGNIELYGFNSYSEVGFDDDITGAAVNIRCRLETAGGILDPVFLLGANPETDGQQLKITYEMTVAVGPSAITTSASSNISDDGNQMSWNKNGTSVVEHLYLSRIDSDGETDLSAPNLEPYYPGSLGLSPSFAALVALAGPDRSDGATFTELEVFGDYVDDSFEQYFQGVFSLNEAIATNWRTMGLYDPDSEVFAYTWLFAANQKKDGEHTLTVRLRKSWNRDLS